MDISLETMVRELYDKQAIREVVINYGRGVDRMDRALLMSCYHPEAIDDHGLFVGAREQFADWADGIHLEEFRNHQHIVTNHSCELNGDVGHTETYWTLAAMTKQDGKLVMLGGRYVDRMEKRDGRWRIAARKCLMEWWGAPADGWLPADALAASAGAGTMARDKTDSSYERPLTVNPGRVGYRFEA